MAKFLITWKIREGLSAQQNHDDLKTMLSTFGKWEQPADQTFHQWVLRLDGNGGAAIVETDDIAGLGRAPQLFAPWLSYEIHPVIDIADGAAMAHEAVQSREAMR
ncbi:MAG TPA: DUF3303 family protein [Mycobacteriales bacterium]|nr:DUF3303 family protein [Mycobacteriales bacterium]